MNTGCRNNDILTGERVRLVAVDPEQFGKDLARWNLSSEFQQLLDSGPAILYTPKQVKDWIEKNIDDFYGFTIQTIEGEVPIGMVDLGGFNWTARDCWVGIGIGERAYWGKGYGTEAMNLVLRYAFACLNMNRVSLNVFEYNPRAYQSYIKCGFQEEGRLRKFLQREGDRYDLIYMGILREAWDAAQGSP